MFLDRDGTLNKPRGHINSPAQLKLYDNVPSAVRRLNEAEFRVVLVTNQPVIARGEATFGDLSQVHARLESELGRVGAFLDRIEMCPHHPDKGFEGEVASLKIRCDCRKPATGMIQKAAVALNVDLDASWMVGDTTTDMLTARRAGLKSMLVETGEAGKDGVYEAQADITVADASAAVSFILDIYPLLDATLAELVRKISPGDHVLVEGCATYHRRAVAKTLEWRLLLDGNEVIPITDKNTSAQAIKLGEETFDASGEYAAKRVRLLYDDWVKADQIMYHGLGSGRLIADALRFSAQLITPQDPGHQC